MMMIIKKESSIRYVIAFPKNGLKILFGESSSIYPITMQYLHVVELNRRKHPTYDQYCVVFDL